MLSRFHNGFRAGVTATIVGGSDNLSVVFVAARVVRVGWRRGAGVLARAEARVAGVGGGFVVLDMMFGIKARVFLLTLARKQRGTRLFKVTWFETTSRVHKRPQLLFRIWPKSRSGPSNAGIWGHPSL